MLAQPLPVPASSRSRDLIYFQPMNPVPFVVRELLPEQDIIFSDLGREVRVTEVALLVVALSN
jgi:hypothetical protein